MTRRVPELKYQPDVLTRAWQTSSMLMDYPDDELISRLDLLAKVVATLPAKLSTGLQQTIDHLSSHPLYESQSSYVDTFDTRRRGCLFLTYFSNGETRKRGMALLRIKQVYTAAGLVLTHEQLPDHLCVVLEFAATGDQVLGRDLMLDHRAGLELLRLSLRDLGSAWAGLVDAVTATLPPLRGDERDAVRRLAAEGPPEEEVGLAPFASPQFSPSAATSRSTLLPMPSFRGARA